MNNALHHKPEHSRRPSPSRKLELGMLALVGIVAVVIVLTVVISTVLEQNAVRQEPVFPTPAAVAERWELERVDASQLTPEEYTLTLSSSAGGVRRYAQISGYGMNGARTMLALISRGDPLLAELSADRTVRLEQPFSIEGVTGNSVSWSSGDEFFSMAAYNPLGGGTSLLIYSRAGLLIREIAGQFYYDLSPKGQPYMAPARFSPTEDLVLIRAYDRADAGASLRPEDLPVLPAYLQVYDLAGRKVAEVQARGMDTEASDLAYKWDESGEFIAYQSVRPGTEVNMGSDAGFTKVRVR